MSKLVKCGRISIGGGAPISIQSMTNVDTADEKALLHQIEELEGAGCDIVRVAIPDINAVNSFGKVRMLTDMPLVCDIHFDYRLAIMAINKGADKIRINPGNIGDRSRLKKVVDAAKKRNIPIRVGVNSGSLSKDIISKYNGVTARGLAESAIDTLREIEDMDYDNLVLSIKSSNVRMNYDAHMIVKDLTDHPMHIGITESGTLQNGKIKSAIGIGSLLLSGIGDTIRVSLTDNPLEEVRLAKEILESIDIRKKAVEIVSCPTCGRTKIDLISLAGRVEEALKPIEEERSEIGLPPIKVAVMGCAVNGPGEAREADYGIAGGIGEGLIFRKGEIIKKVPEQGLIIELIKIIKDDYGKTEKI